jgi:hypothetical protein
MSNLIQSRKSRVTAVLATAAVSMGIMAGPAAAQPQQNGLVNVNISGNTVQLPVSLAANVCHVQVAALAQQLGQTGTGDCNASADSTATRNPRG